MTTDDPGIDAVAEHLHRLYLPTARGMGWTRLDKPFAQLPADAKEAARALARAFMRRPMEPVVVRAADGYAHLNLGCGTDIRVGWTNADLAALPGVDVVFDMNETPWPWDDDTFADVAAIHCLEHTRDLPPVLDELWRVCRHGATIHVEAPHFFSSPATWDDPTHRRPMGPGTFQYFCPGAAYQHEIGRARFVTLEVGHSNLYLSWHLAVYKQHDAALLARHVDYGNWKAKWEGRA